MPENEPNWQEVEKSVNQAEEAQRQADQASADIYDATGKTKEERASSEIENGSRVLKKATEREGFFDEEAKKILGAKESPQNELVRLRWNNLISALRAEREIEKKKQALLDEESDIIKQPEKTPSSSELDAIDEIRQEKDELDAQRQQLLESTPEAYFGLHLKELKEYQRGLRSARIVETPYVRSQIDDIVTHFRAGKPVMIYGHLGTGKTEIALHTAKKYLGKEALVISGSKHTTLAELYGHQVLSLEETRHEEIETYVREVEDKYNQWLEKNKTKLDEMSAAQQEGEKNRAHDRFLQTFLSAHQGGTVSDFFMGPIYRAMEEGRPVIIDEVNAIPHEVLISLNHILTRRPGETINVQQDSGRTITIKDGFGVMMTGNLNQGQERYIDREDLDPAFLSRLYKIEHDYLPQRKEGELDETDGSDEQFSLALSMLMDKNGNLDLPQGSVRQLWRLSQVARVFQDIFAGREVEGAYYQQAGENSVVYFLKESVLSLRAMDSIISQWQKEGFRYELDYYIWQEFVSQATIASDRAFLYQVLHDRFGFFQTDGWEQSPNYGSGGMVNSFQIKPPQNSAARREFLGPRRLVEYAFGQPPERSKWPEGVMPNEEAGPEENQVEKLMEQQERANEIKKRLRALKGDIETA